MSSSGTPISSLPAAVTPLDGSEELAGVQAGSTVKIPTSALVRGPSSSATGHVALFSGTGGNLLEQAGLGQIPGTATNDSATAGNTGEYIFQTVLVGAAVPLTNAMAANVTSISLTAGDWDVWGSIATNPAAGTTTTGVLGWISTTSATNPNAPNNGAFVVLPAMEPATAVIAVPVGMMRLSLSGTTTAYLSMLVNFGTSTNAGYGFIGARRAR